MTTYATASQAMSARKIAFVIAVAIAIILALAAIAWLFTREPPAGDRPPPVLLAPA
jgi:hypothetical protein